MNIISFNDRKFSHWRKISKSWLCTLVAKFKLRWLFFTGDNTLYLYNTFLLRSSKHFTTIHYLIASPFRKRSVKCNDHSFTDENTKTNGASDLPRSQKDPTAEFSLDVVSVEIQHPFHSVLNERSNIYLHFQHYYVYKLPDLESSYHLVQPKKCISWIW